MPLDCTVTACSKNDRSGKCTDGSVLACYLRSMHPVRVDKEDEHLFTHTPTGKPLRCPNCGSENIDGLGVDQETGDASYGCGECNTWFIIKGEPYTFKSEEGGG